MVLWTSDIANAILDKKKLLWSKNTIQASNSVYLAISVRSLFIRITYSMGRITAICHAFQKHPSQQQSHNAARGMCGKQLRAPLNLTLENQVSLTVPYLQMWDASCLQYTNTKSQYLKPSTVIESRTSCRWLITLNMKLCYLGSWISEG